MNTNKKLKTQTKNALLPTQIKKQLDSCFNIIQNRVVVRKMVLLCKKIDDNDLSLILPILDDFTKRK